MDFFKALINFGAGHRTEILGGIYTILRILAEVGVIPRAAADAAGEIIRPAAMMTFAAKVSRVVNIKEQEAVEEGLITEQEAKP